MTVTIHIRIEDPDGQSAGHHYLAWIKANELPQTADTLRAFVAGWAIATERAGVKG